MTKPMKVELKILNKKFYREESNGVLLNPLPNYTTHGSAALDLVCTENCRLNPQQRLLIPTGLAIWIGSGISDNLLGVAGMILPRSGLGTKGLVLANTVGLIDEDYQGELKISAWNSLPFEDSAIFLQAGDRIAQIMFIPVLKVAFNVVDEFSNATDRGVGGFGSSG